MASTETRPSFRLPWSAGPADSGELSEPAEDPDDAATEPSSKHNPEGTADMIEMAAPDQPPAPSEPPSTGHARRATAFMAELSHAMQAAAEHARSEAMARLEGEAKSVVEEINAGAATEAADLRRQADDDIAGIRDWSKAEIARLREVTEERISGRKTGLEGELERHGAMVQARTERVGAVMASYEAQMAAFFERLSLEEDPTRIATLAETMPEPPSLADVAASVASSPTVLTLVPEPAVDSEPTDSTVQSDEVDFAAAEAEAATFSADLESEDGDSSATGIEATSEAVGELIVEVSSAAEQTETTTRVVVSGLVSVANIAAFKRGLGRIAGVSTIGVASGREGEFVYNVTHGVGPELAASIKAMPAFDIDITEDTSEVIQLAARDHDAGA